MLWELGLKFPFCTSPKGSRKFSAWCCLVYNIAEEQSFLLSWLLTSYCFIGVRESLISKETKNINGLTVRLLRLYSISEERSLLFSLMKKVTKKSSLKIKSSKTTSKWRSAARAVRLPGSTRGLLPLYFFVVLLCFLFKGGIGVVWRTFT